MKFAMLKFLAAVLLLLAACSDPSDARPRGNSVGSSAPAPPAGPCPYGSAYADGCAGAPAGGQMIDSNFFTSVRQSGQAKYKALGGTPTDHPPPWNVAGVDYAIGAYTVDASLKDPLTNPPAGCNWAPVYQYLRCSTATNIVGYRMNGVAVYSDAGPINIENNHFTETARSCRNHAGTFIVHIISGTNPQALSNTIDFENGCSIVAGLYKQSGDPGLVTQSTETISIAANVMTVGSGTTGTIRPYQNLNWSGIPAVTQITTLVAPVAVSISSITISAGVATVTTSAPHGLGVGMEIATFSQQPTGYQGQAVIASVPSSTTFTFAIPAGNTVPGGSATTKGSYQVLSCTGASCDGTQWNVTGTVTRSSIAATTGPVQWNANGFMGGGDSLLALYNYGTGMGEYFGGGETGKDYILKYNYGKMQSYAGMHTNFAINLPGSPGTIPNYIQDFNTVWWDHTGFGQSGTGTIDHFATGPAANTGFVDTTLSQSSNNVIIANLSDAYGTSAKPAAALLRMLNQAGATHGKVTYTLSGGVLTVTSNVGAAIVVGDYITCQNCHSPVQVVSFGTGTGGNGTYNVSNASDIIGYTNVSVFPWPGRITQMNWQNNYLDATGANGPFLADFGNVPVGASSSSGNVNMLTGNSCTFASCN